MLILLAVTGALAAWAVVASAASPSATTRESLVDGLTDPTFNAFGFNIAEGGDASRNSSVSADGRFVAFDSRSRDLAGDPPDSDFLSDIFVRDRATNSTTLASIRPDGGRFDGHAQAPSISGDGSKVAFQATSRLAPTTSQGLANFDEFVFVDATDGDLRKRKDDGTSPEFDIPDEPTFPIARPRVSPDGTTIAHEGVEGGETSIYLTDIATGTTTRLTNPPDGVDHHTPAWSPDGTRIAYFATAGTEWGLDVVTTVDGVVVGTADTLDNGDHDLGPGGFSAFPDWSPDGETIVYARPSPIGTEDEGPHLYTIDVTDATPTPTLLTTGAAGAFETTPAWSPRLEPGTPSTEHLIAFSRTVGGTTTLHLIEAGGTGEVDVVADGENPAWSPDGRRVIFSRADGVHIIDPFTADATEQVHADNVAAHYIPRQLGVRTPAMDSARVLSSEAGVAPEGQVRFFLCGPLSGESCAGGIQVGIAQTLTPDSEDADVAVAESMPSSTPPARSFAEPGSYCWRAEYSGSFVHAASSDAAVERQCFEVTKSGVDTFEARANEFEGSIHNFVTMDPDGDPANSTPPPALGVVAFYLCGPDEIDAGGCSSGGEFVGIDYLLGNGGNTTHATSPDATLSSGDGTYCWRAEYSGSGVYQPAIETNRNESCFIEGPGGDIPEMSGTVVKPSATARPGSFSGTLSVALVDPDIPDATPDPTPEGTATFFLCGPPEVVTTGCLTGGTQVGDPVTLADDDIPPDGIAEATSIQTDETPLEGSYCWRVEYSGDANYEPNELTSPDCFVLRQAWNESTGERTDIYVRDLAAGTTVIASVSGDGGVGDGDSFDPSLSSDGMHVAFESNAANLVAEDTYQHGTMNVFLRDLGAETTQLVSVLEPCVAVGGVSSLAASDCFTGESFDPSTSADGGFVAFASFSDNLEAEYPDGTPYNDPFFSDGPSQVYVRDVANGRTILQSVDARDAPCDEEELEGPCPGFESSDQPSISANGSRVAFRSWAENLLPSGEDGNFASDIFLRDRPSATTRRVSVDSAGNEALDEETEESDLSREPAISGDGRSVAFASQAPNLVEDDTNMGNACDGSLCNNGHDIFLHDTVTGVTDRVSETSDGLEAALDGETPDSRRPSVSFNARYIGFDSSADNLAGSVAGDLIDQNGRIDVFVHDRIPVLQLTPNPVAFGGVGVGTTSAPLMVTATNIGNGPFEFTGLALGGADVGDFRIVDALDGCTGETLFAGEICTVGVVFEPTAMGARTGTFTATGFTVTGTPPTASTNLTGTGTVPPLRTLAISPSPLLFGPQAIGATSAPRVVTATSTGDSPVTITDIDIAGADAGAFSLNGPGADTCSGAVLDPGESCQVVLVFEPTARRLHSAQLVFDDNAVGNPQVVPLRGTGQTARLRITPRPVDFGFAAPRRRGEERIATLTNVGDTALTVSTVAVAGEQADHFDILSDDCTGETLAPGDGCGVQLRFLPRPAGRYSAVLRATAEGGAPTARARLIGSAPRLRINPPLSRRGFVPEITGRFFPPRRVLVLAWEPGIGQVRVRTDRNGRFRTRLLVMRRDQLGPRVLLVRRLGFVLFEEFLVVPGSLQPPEFNARY